MSAGAEPVCRVVPSALRPAARPTTTGRQGSQGIQSQGVREAEVQRAVQGIEALCKRGYRPREVEIVCDWLFLGGLLIQPLSQAFGASIATLSLQLRLGGSRASTLGLPTSPADWGASVAAALPSLDSLSMHLDNQEEEKAAEPLLGALAPRLCFLSVNCSWPGRLPDGVKACTSLERLSMRTNDAIDDEPSLDLHGASQSISDIARLTSLRSLELASDFEGVLPGIKDPGVQLGPLRELTGLSRLVLTLPKQIHMYCDAPDSIDEVGRFLWFCWPVAQLVARMRDLAELAVPVSNISAEDCVQLASMTALTRLCCQAIATPPPGRCGSGAVGMDSAGGSDDKDGSSPAAAGPIGGGNGDGDGALANRNGGAASGSGGCGGGGGGAAEVPAVPLPPNLKELQVSCKLPTLHMAASLAAHPSKPRLVLDGVAYLSVGLSARLTLLGGSAVSHDSALPTHEDVVAPWLAAVAAQGARFIADSARNTYGPEAAGTLRGGRRGGWLNHVDISELAVYEGYDAAGRAEDTMRGAGDFDGDGDYDSDGYGGDFHDGLRRRRYSQHPGRRHRFDIGAARQEKVQGPHAEWLAALAPLGSAFTKLSMVDVALSRGDMRALVSACPHITSVQTGQQEDHSELLRIQGRSEPGPRRGGGQKWGRRGGYR